MMRIVLARMVWEFDLEAVEGRRVDWTILKCWIMIEKAPVFVRIRAVR